MSSLAPGQRWTVRGVLQRACQVLREDGPRSLWFKLLGQTFYRRAGLYACELDVAPTAASTPLQIELGILPVDAIDEYLALRPDADADDIRRRLAAGQRCFTARHQGRLIHVCWVAAGRATIDYLGREIQLTPSDVYSYQSFTLPDFRGNNVAAVRDVYQRQAMHHAGYRRMISVVVPENKAGMRAVEKAGYPRIGTLRTVWLGGIRGHFGRISGPRQSAPRPPNAAYWDSVLQASDRQSHYLDPQLGDLKRQVHLDLIARWGGLPPSGCVLKTDLFEEALGPDAFLLELAGCERTVIGIDISPDLVRRAKQHDGDRRARYLVADVRRLPLADRSCAMIVSSSTLDHFVDPADLGRSLGELRRLLTDSGRLIVTLDNRQNVFDPLLRMVNRLGWLPYYVGRSYTIAELRRELTAVDLVVADTTAILHNPRLVAAAVVAIANRLGWPPLRRWVQGRLVAAQRLEHTRWRYRTGSFIAALAVRKTAAQ